MTTSSTQDAKLNTAGSTPQPLRILAVDDNESDILLLQRAINQSHLPIELRTISNPGNALAAIKEPDGSIAIDFVLLDIRMPAINGHDLLGAIRRKAEFSDLPVFILTTSDQQSDINRARELGANSYFVKPLNLSFLTELVKDLYGCWIRREVPGHWPED